MRRNLKKPVALLTVALTAAFLLAGCGGSAGESANADAQVKETGNDAAETTTGGSESEGSASAEEVSYPLADGGTLTYWLQLNPNVSANFTNLGETELGKHGRSRPVLPWNSSILHPDRKRNSST